MQPVPAGYPIELLSGPLIVAYLLHWGLFGTLSVQLYLYYLAFPKDRRFTKCLVYGIYVVEFVQTILATADAFSTFGYGFGNMEVMTRMDFNWLVIPIMSGIVAFVGQVFYAYRIFILSKSRTIPALITCVSLTSTVAAIITGIYCFQAGDVSKLKIRKMYIAFGIWCGASALCDITIAICMAFYLMHSNTSFRQTRMLITKLIRLTIETGSVTAVAALLSFILYFAFPHQNFYVTPALIVPKLYANSVLVVLNSRIQILGGRNTYTSSTDISITTTMIRDMTSQSTEGTQPTDVMQGRVSVVVTTPEVFNDDHEMGRRKENSQGSSMSLSV